MTDFMEDIRTRHHFQLDTKSILYQHEIPTNQNDKLSDEVILDILHSNAPYNTLLETIENLYVGYITNLKNQIQKEVDFELNSLSSTDISAVVKRMYFIYPIEHYLQQKFKVNIIADTGNFLIEMTLKDLISLNILIRQRSDKCITIQGATLPIKLIRSALPDRKE